MSLVGKKMGRNRELTNAQRKVVCLHKETTSISNRELSQWATEKFAFPVSEMTISRTLKKKDQWIFKKSAPDGKRARKLVCPEVEEATYAWFVAMQEKGAPLTDALVCEAAKRFYANLDHDSAVKRLVFSHGWLGRFKKRHNIRGYAKQREIAVTDASQEVLSQVDSVKSVMMDYEPSDIFSLEETGLLFALKPSKTFASTRMTTARMPKERILVGFTANMDGSIKLPPLVINKYSRPRAFTSRNILNPINLGLLWQSHSLAWMSIPIFERFLLDFEKRMLLAGKTRVLLLVESAHSHKLANVEKELTITVVKFLPNACSLYPPVDAGIVSFVKAAYRKSLLKHQMDCFSSGKDAEVDIYNAVVFLEKSWRLQATPTIISSFWRYTSLYRNPSIVSKLENGKAAFGTRFQSSNLSSDTDEQLHEISLLIKQLGVCSLACGSVPDMSAQEYLHYEDLNGLATFNEPTESEIWEASLCIEESDDEFDHKEAVDIAQPVKYSTVQSSLHSIRLFLRQQPVDVTDMLLSIQNLDTRLATYNSCVENQHKVLSYL